MTVLFSLCLMFVLVTGPASTVEVASQVVCSRDLLKCYKIQLWTTRSYPYNPRSHCKGFNNIDYGVLYTPEERAYIHNELFDAQLNANKREVNYDLWIGLSKLPSSTSHLTKYYSNACYDKEGMDYCRYNWRWRTPTDDIPDDDSFPWLSDQPQANDNVAQYVSYDGAAKGAQIDEKANGFLCDRAMKCAGPIPNHPYATVVPASGVRQYVEAVYTCNTGYSLSGSTTTSYTKKCLNDETWPLAPTTAICKEIKCPALNVEKASVVYESTRKWYYQNKATVTCDPRYSFNRLDKSQTSKQYTCQNTRKWSGGPNKCEQLVCIKDHVKFASASEDSTVPGATASFTCSNGYALDPFNITDISWTSLCDEDTITWVPKRECHRIECGSPAEVEHATPANSSTVYEAIASYQCQSGYALNAEDKDHNSFSSVCQDNATWTAVDEFRCQRIKCATPPKDVDNGQLKFQDNETLYGDTANYTCQEGFSFDPHNASAIYFTATCLPDATWLDAPPCMTINCSLPDMVYTSAEVTTMLLNTTANLTCDSGWSLDPYNLSDIHFDSICLSNGSWAWTPECQKIACQEPVQSLTSVDFNSTMFEDVAVFMCVSGYSLNASDPLENTFTASCQDNATWSQTPPCIKVDCNVPEELVHANLTYNETVYESAASYACHPGYVTNPLDPTSNEFLAKCTANGTWGYSLCQRVDCGEPSIEFAEMEANTTLYEYNATYSCLPGYDLELAATETEPFVTCSSQGKWTQANGFCRDINECLSNPCNNDGSCNDEVNMYSCSCLDGYLGVICEFVHVFISVTFHIDVAFDWIFMDMNDEATKSLVSLIESQINQKLRAEINTNLDGNLSSLDDPVVEAFSIDSNPIKHFDGSYVTLFRKVNEIVGVDLIVDVVVLNEEMATSQIQQFILEAMTAVIFTLEPFTVLDGNGLGLEVKNPTIGVPPAPQVPVITPVTIQLNEPFKWDYLNMSHETTLNLTTAIEIVLMEHLKEDIADFEFVRVLLLRKVKDKTALDLDIGSLAILEQLVPSVLQTSVNNSLLKHLSQREIAGYSIQYGKATDISVREPHAEINPELKYVFSPVMITINEIFTLEFTQTNSTPARTIAESMDTELSEKFSSLENYQFVEFALYRSAPDGNSTMLNLYVITLAKNEPEFKPGMMRESVLAAMASITSDNQVATVMLLPSTTEDHDVYTVGEPQIEDVPQKQMYVYTRASVHLLHPFIWNYTIIENEDTKSVISRVQTQFRPVLGLYVQGYEHANGFEFQPVSFLSAKDNNTIIHVNVALITNVHSFDADMAGNLSKLVLDALTNAADDGTLGGYAVAKSEDHYLSVEYVEKEIQCNYPKVLTNSNVTWTSTSTGDLATYNCRLGFSTNFSDPNGNTTTSTCEQFAKWSPPLPCKKIRDDRTVGTIISGAFIAPVWIGAITGGALILYVFRKRQIQRRQIQAQQEYEKDDGEGDDQAEEDETPQKLPPKVPKVAWPE